MNVTKIKNVLKSIEYHDSSNVMPLLMVPSVLFGDKEHSGTEMPDSAIKRNLQDDMSYNSRERVKLDELFEEKEHSLSALFVTSMQSYMSAHPISDMTNDNLNIFTDSAAINTTADILDFTQYESQSNILSDAMTKLRDRNINDLSILWTTQEYVRIKYSKTIEYVVRRLGYDSKKQCIDYEIIEYENRLIYKNIAAVIPVFIADIAVSLCQYNNVPVLPETDVEGNIIQDDLNKEMILWSSVQNMQSLIKSDEFHEYIYPKMILKKTSTIEDVVKFIKRYVRTIENTHPDSKDTTSARYVFEHVFNNVAIDIFDDILPGPDETHDIDKSYLKQYTYYLRQKMSISFACIVIANAMLAENKLSNTVEKPAGSMPKHMIAEKNTIINKTDMRKIRHLGKIRIISEKKPSTPTMQKIIRYSLSEWQRQGFIRHYKNGKTVNIMPTTVHRKCVDANKLSKAEPKSTEYIIHSAKTKKERT